MLSPFQPPNKKRLRMDLTLQVDGKKKSPTKGFFYRINSSFRSPFSPKKLIHRNRSTTIFIRRRDYVDDVDVDQPSEAVAVTQPPSDGPQFSLEEERLAFLSKGKGLLNTPRNYIPIYRPSPKQWNQPPKRYSSFRPQVFRRNGNALTMSSASFRF